MMHADFLFMCSVMVQMSSSGTSTSLQSMWFLTRMAHPPPALALRSFLVAWV